MQSVYPSMSTCTSLRWTIRAFRLWFVLFVPFAGITGFHFLHSTLGIAEAYREVHAWIEIEQQREVKGLRGPVTDTDVRFKLLGFNIQSLTERRNTAATLLIFALAAPALCFLLLRLGQWIWVGTSPSCASVAPKEAATLSSYKAAYLWWAGVGGAIMLAFFVSPERAIQAGISGVIQSAAIAAVAWLGFRLWHGRRK